MTIHHLRQRQSSSPALQRMVAFDLASFDATGRAKIFSNRAALLRQSILEERYPTDCAWPGVEMADIASLYELAADDLAQAEQVAA